jgi:Zn-dependent membrane protease YugP
MDIFFLILVLPAFIFSLFAQFKVKSTFKRFSQLNSRRGFSGADAARKILDEKGLSNIRVEVIDGDLTDHYDPVSRVLRLSQTTYSSTSIAAIGVAAHEAGHALQHKDMYLPLTMRSILVPAANIGSSFGPIMAMAGLLMRWSLLIHLGIILFAFAVVFYMITLPVEFNASNRAIAVLSRSGILEEDELNPAREVLNAAAMTYVASALVAIASLLRLIFISRRNN